MSARLDRLRGRLHPLVREGELTSALLAVPSLQIDALDEELDWVQRERWFDSALELDDVAKLAAVLGFTAESWQGVVDLRLWVHALRDARLQRGAVTPQAVRELVAGYARGHASATGVECVRPLTPWADRRDSTRPALIEQPPVRRWASVPDAGGTPPLARVTLQNRGLTPSTPTFFFTCLAPGPERCPVIVNLTSGRGLVFLGEIRVGSRLVIADQGEGVARATLDGEPATDRLFGLDDVVPGRAWGRADLREHPMIPPLERGDNELWYLPVAHFDEHVLDGPMLALPDLDVRAGQWDQSAFDHALYEQTARVQLRVTWIESQPASFRVELPAGIMRSQPGELDEALAARTRLGRSLSAAIDQVRPAAVAGSCELRPFTEMQRAVDRLRILATLTLRDAGSVGADALRDRDGVFEESDFDGSTFD